MEDGEHVNGECIFKPDGHLEWKGTHNNSKHWYGT